MFWLNRPVWSDPCLIRFQRSIVDNVDPELNVAVSDDISAANITANSNPYLFFYGYFLT